MPSPTTTTRLALVKPDPNPTTGDFVDITTISGNMDKLDAATGAVACTSSARPGSPYNGQFARETDTGQLILWNGSAWVDVMMEGSPAVGGATICTSSTRPSSPWNQQLIYETDTKALVIRSGAAWVQVCTNRRVGWRGRRVAAQSCATGAVTNISFDTEDEDSDNFLTPHATTGTTFTIPSNGIYSISFIAITSIFTSSRNFTQLEFITGITGFPTGVRNSFLSAEDNTSISATVRLDAGNTFKASVFHVAAGSQNFTGFLQVWKVAD